jgi:hypothetical protein
LINFGELLEFNFLCLSEGSYRKVAEGFVRKKWVYAMIIAAESL